MMHAAYNMALALALAIACVSHGCGPVGLTSTSAPVEAPARRTLAAALRAALCRATLPHLDAHPLARIAWDVACSHTQPAVGVSPALPPAPPSEVP
jgi:hypothetical protein